MKEISTDGDGITVDTKTYEVKVTVTDKGDGTLNVVASDNAKALNFVNTYEATGSVTFEGKKGISGREMTEDDVFTFEITDGENTWTVKNDATGAIAYPTIEYTLDDLGEHTYTVKETSTDGDGITMDAKTYEVKVTVTDNGDGTLKVEATENYIELDFVNKYEATGSVTFEGTKTISGREMTDKDIFTFEIMEGDKLVAEVKNDATGKIAYPEIEYTLDDLGEHTYTVKETSTNGDGITVDANKTDKAGYTTDATVYTVKVAVTDNGDGTLKVEKAITANGKAAVGMTFDNKYTAKLTLSKKVEGCTTSEAFPITVRFYDEKHNVRFIAVNSGVDSANQQDNDFTPFLNIINEFYVKDSSKKVTASMRHKGESGEYLTTNPPYGYMKDPVDPKRHWIVDEEAAANVRQIFAWCMEGYGPTQIARKLRDAKIECPAAHCRTMSICTPTKVPGDPYAWSARTVGNILERLEYLGHMVNFRTHRPSYKIKKSVDNPVDQWKIFENTHEAIIDADTFARVQELRKNKRRPARTGKTNMFSGIVRCADCGEKLYYCTSKSFETRQDHFVCSTSRKKGKDACDTHFIRAVVLEEGVLQHMRLVISCVACYEDVFREALGAKRTAEAKKELAAKRKALQKAETRLAELDKLFKRIYEDMVAGRLSETRFQMLSDDYDREQAELRVKIDQLTREIAEQEDQAENVERFIRQVKKYLCLDKLTPTILNDMVNTVYVHAPDKSNGHRVQQIEISYNYVGILPVSLLQSVQHEKTA